jgi:hypothetical protein
MNEMQQAFLSVRPRESGDPEIVTLDARLRGHERRKVALP